MTDDKSPKTAKTEEKKPTSPQYTQKQLDQHVKNSLEAERSRLNRLNESKLSEALEKQETALKKEFEEKLVKHTQEVRKNSYDAVLEAMRQMFLTKQSNLSFPAITVNEYHELVEEYGSESQKNEPLL